MRIALFSTCLNDAMFPQAPQATVRLLERLGHQVDFPSGQACCGQMHINSGYFDEAVPIIRNHVQTFEPILDDHWDAIVVPSGSCTGSIKHQQAMVARHSGDARLAHLAGLIAEKTYDLPVFLTDVLGLEDTGAYFPHRVTYHPTCHSLRLTRVGDRPRRLLENVEGLDLVPLPDADVCCGFGGTFSLKNPEMSAAMVEEKAFHIHSTGAHYVVAGDYSCLMNIGGALARNNSGVRAMHIAEILAGTRDQPWQTPAYTSEVGSS